MLKNWSIGIKERDVAESKEKSNLKQAKKQRNYKKNTQWFWDRMGFWNMENEDWIRSLCHNKLNMDLFGMGLNLCIFVYWRENRSSLAPLNLLI